MNKEFVGGEKFSHKSHSNPSFFAKERDAYPAADFGEESFRDEMVDCNDQDIQMDYHTPNDEERRI